MIVTGAVLLGAPALALLTREPPAVLLAVSLVRGIGFGLCGVATGALAATSAAPGPARRGLGLLGLVSGVPAVIALPAGVWLAGHHLATAVAVLAAAAGAGAGGHDPLAARPRRGRRRLATPARRPRSRSGRRCGCR